MDEVTHLAGLVGKTGTMVDSLLSVPSTAQHDCNPYLTHFYLGEGFSVLRPYHITTPTKVICVQLFDCTEEPHPALNVIRPTAVFEEPNRINSQFFHRIRNLTSCVRRRC